MSHPPPSVVSGRRHTNRAARLLWVLVLGHFAITLVHGAAHAAARVPMSLAANVFIAVVIVIGPIVGLLVFRARPVVGGWIVAATMAGAFLFGVVNHFFVASADHVSHVDAEWRALFSATAILLAATEVAATAAGVFCARQSRRA
jgi:hypothetical protein